MYLNAGCMNCCGFSSPVGNKSHESPVKTGGDGYFSGGIGCMAAKDAERYLDAVGH